MASASVTATAAATQKLSGSPWQHCAVNALQCCKHACSVCRELAPPRSNNALPKLKRAHTCQAWNSSFLCAVRALFRESAVPKQLVKADTTGLSPSAVEVPLPMTLLPLPSRSCTVSETLLAFAWHCRIQDTLSATPAIRDSNQSPRLRAQRSQTTMAAWKHNPI